MAWQILQWVSPFVFTLMTYFLGFWWAVARRQERFDLILDARFDALMAELKRLYEVSQIEMQHIKVSLSEQERRICRLESDRDEVYKSGVLTRRSSDRDS